MTRRLLRSALALPLAAVICASATGCTSTSLAGSRPSGGISTSSESAATSSVGSVAMALPTGVPAIPAGVYRTSIRAPELVAAGVEDLGNAGVFTLTIRAGTYVLACVPVPGSNCGGTANKQHITEVGAVRGSGHVVWFVQDNERKATLTGCVVNSESDSGCGANDPYSLTWQLTPKGLTFHHFVGLGDEAGSAGGYVNLTFQPWTKIG